MNIFSHDTPEKWNSVVIQTIVIPILSLETKSSDLLQAADTLQNPILTQNSNLADVN